MARRQRKLKVSRSPREELPEFKLSSQTKRGILIVVAGLLGILSLLGLFDAAGGAGRLLARILTLFLGSAAFVAPLVFFGLGLALFLAARREKEGSLPSANLRIYLGSGLFVASLTGLLHLWVIREDPQSAFELVRQSRGGGYLGVLLAYPLLRLLDFWASFFVLLGGLIISLVLTFNLNLANIFRRSKDSLTAAAKAGQNFPGLGNGVKINQMPPADFSVAKVDVSPPPVTAPESPPPRSQMEKPAEQENEEDEEPLSPIKVVPQYRKGTWILPALSLLEDSHDSVDSGNIEANVTIIQKTLSDFGIPVEMGEVNVGPTVTQYTLRPAQGIKLSQIVALQNDLALALAAPSIRIEAPIPGKSLVGIEIPNKTYAMVRLKDIVKGADLTNHKSNLAFALGRDVAGHPMVADLAKMPHLLIAGATGTGKSVAINSMLISLLYHNSPEELRFIIVDPKRVELNLYNGIPHLLTPVVTDYAKAVNALKWAVSEMDRRYNLLAQNNKRNIIEYNANAADKLPYILIIVDELADLMAVAQADVEAAVVRLAQMARAVGVHLILATQRPSVDIITGLIKANITARIAFAVASQVDSRTILDVAGAEKLLGAGDMLYVTAELGKPRRIQGTYISEKEVKNVVEFVRQQAGEVEYDEEILEKQKAKSVTAELADEAADEELLDEAIQTVKRTGKASATLLQRHLRIGYARAARLLDLLEQKGIVGPGEGAKPRDVYVNAEPEYNEEEQ